MKRWLARLVDLLSGCLFTYAGIVKAVDPTHFLRDVENYHLVHTWLAASVAIYLPWMEICCGLALIVGRLKSGARFILVVLMMIFIGAMATAWWRGINLHCGCFGAATSSVVEDGYIYLLLRDVVILAGLAFAGIIDMGWVKRRSDIPQVQK
jgi:uncharacterized membrane protein YphA (DoxX/SURF4 family)